MPRNMPLQYPGGRPQAVIAFAASNLDNAFVPGFFRMLPAVLAAGVLLHSQWAAGANAAAPVWRYRAWQTEEGLPDNRVTGIAQTADGYVWVATLGGLIRFNGVRFEKFSTLHLPGVPNRVVRKMLLDQRGRLWLALDRGPVIRVEGRSVRVFTEKDGLLDARLAAMADDREGNVWLAYASVVCRVAGEEVIRAGETEGWPAGAGAWVERGPSGTLWAARGSQVGTVSGARWREVATLDDSPVRLCASRTNGLWICTPTQLLRLKGGSGVEVVARLPEKAAVRAMLEDRNGRLWVGTADDGLLCFAGGALERVSTSHPEIVCLMEDREGNLWVGTAGGGLNLLRAQALDLVGTTAGLPSESVRSVCQDREGWLWAALNDGTLARGREGAWRAAGPGDGWPGGNVSCVAPGRDGGIWAGTRDQGLWFLRDQRLEKWGRSEGLGGHVVRSVLGASNGDVWVGLDSPGRLVRFRNGVFATLKLTGKIRSLRALAEARNGVIWAGTSDGQIFRVEHETLVADPLLREDRRLSVRALHATADGSLWIGYAGWGLGHLADGRYTRITTREGLFDDYVSQIMSDETGGLWLTGNHGLFQVRQEELLAVSEARSTRVRSMVYGRSEGLKSFQPNCENTPSACRTADGTLWFATLNGLLRVQANRIRDNPEPPPVMLERVTVDDRILALRDAASPLLATPPANCLDLATSGLTLPFQARHRKLEFHFAALSFTSPENVHFRYRLENFDREWIEAGAQTSAKYPQLPAGNYEFQVQACNNAGVWNEAGFRLKLAVAPFFWQTWWFRFCLAAAFAFCVAGLVRYFSFRRLRRKLTLMEQQEVLHHERARIARDMHDEVGAKLSRLSLLSEMATQHPGLPSAAHSEVAEISETARDAIRSFDEIVWAVNPRNYTLANLVHYLCRFAEEFFEGSTTQCAFELPPEIPDLELPTEQRHHLFLAAKEALNNAYKHADADRVVVRAALSGEEFEITIEDNGCGFEPGAAPARASLGNGLGNMRERMKLAGGACEITSHPGAGTRAAFKLNLARSHDRTAATPETSGN